MYKARSFLLLFMASSVLFACKQDRQHSFKTSYDVVQEFCSQIQPETQLIDFRAEAHPEYYLLRGWASSEPLLTWTNANESSLLFYTYNIGTPLDVEVTWKAAYTQQRQMARIFANEVSIAAFSFEIQDFHSVKFTIPSSALRAGENFLRFHFTYTTKPQETSPESVDQKKLAVAFQMIRFHNNQHLTCGNDTGIIQQTDSAFNRFVELPETFELEVQYQSLQGAESAVEIVSEQGEIKRLRLPSRKTIYKKTIHLPEAGLYKIQFMTEGKNGSYTVWKQIRLNLPAPDNSNQVEEQRFVKRAQPDIVLYVIDALRADHLGCYGYQRNTSPNIDRFAEEHALYVNAYANASWSRPSGATIVSGLFPKHHHAMLRSDKLPDGVVTLAEILQEQGYYTIAFIGNWNVSHVFGFEQGFVEFREFLKRYPGTQHVQSDTINENVFEFLDTYLKKQDRLPLFILIWAVDPHDPYTPEESVKNLFDIDRYTPIDTYMFDFVANIRSRKVQLPSSSQIEYIKTRYDQEIYFNDMSFGSLLEKMKSLGMYDDAFIMFTADHGEEFFEHGGVGHGQTLYNDQVKIPFIIKSPFVEAKIHKEWVQHIDIYPTILDVLGLNEPYPLDGISLLRNNSTDRTLYFEEVHDGNDLNAILDGGKKLIYNKSFDRPPSKEIVPVLELYHLEDSREQNNLVPDHFEDELRLQKLFLYRNGKSALDLRQTEIEIPPELDQRLKELGYIK